MSNVDDYLAATEMRFNRKGGCSDRSVVAAGVNTQRLLVDQAEREHSWFCTGGALVRSTDDRTAYDQDGFFLEHGAAQSETIKTGGFARARVYGHAYPSMGTIRLQYWFFYGYDELPYLSGTIGHQGDWEHIAVTLDGGTETVSEVLTSAHGGVTSHAPDAFAWADAAGTESSALTESFTHPVVYSALGKHASYPNVGTHPVSFLGVDFSDQTDAGPAMLTWEPGRLVNVGERWAPLNDQQFIRYGGLWGNIGLTASTSGPPGPAFQSSWGSPQESPPDKVSP